MYHVSAQGVDERMINVQYYYLPGHRVATPAGCTGRRERSGTGGLSELAP